MAYSVLVADKHPLYREGLARIIDSWDEFSVAGDASDGIEVIDKARMLSPDIVLMDAGLAHVDGMEVTGTLAKECPDAAVVLLAMDPSQEDLLSAIVSGVRGYLLKDTHVKDLRNNLQAVAGGRHALAPEAIATCFDLIRRCYYAGNLEGSRASQLKLSLTARERDLLRCIAVGASNKEIGAKLYMGESTVKKQVSRLLMKLGMENRTQAAVFALRTGLVD